MVDKRKRGRDSNKNNASVVNEDNKSNVKPLSIPKVDEDDKSNVKPLRIPKVDGDDKSNVEPLPIPKVDGDDKSDIKPLLIPKVDGEDKSKAETLLVPKVDGDDKSNVDPLPHRRDSVNPGIQNGNMNQSRRRTMSNNSASSYGDNRPLQAQGCSYAHYVNSPKLASNDIISLQVVDQNYNLIIFKIKRSTMLEKLMNAYCERQNEEFNRVYFLFSGRRLKPDHTPEELEMEDGDEIVALVSQIGS